MTEAGSGATIPTAGALNALREAGADPRNRRVLLLGRAGPPAALAITLVCESPPERLTILGVVADEVARLAG